MNSRDRLSFLEARMGTILNIAEGPLTAAAQKEIARLAKEAVHEITLAPERILENRITETRAYFSDCCDDYPECMHNR